MRDCGARPRARSSRALAQFHRVDSLNKVAVAISLEEFRDHGARIRSRNINLSCSRSTIKMMGARITGRLLGGAARRFYTVGQRRDCA